MLTISGACLANPWAFQTVRQVSASMRRCLKFRKRRVKFCPPLPESLVRLELQHQQATNEIAPPADDDAGKFLSKSLNDISCVFSWVGRRPLSAGLARCNRFVVAALLGGHSLLEPRIQPSKMNAFANELRRKIKQALLDSPAFRRFAQSTNATLSKRIPADPNDKQLATSNDFTRFLHLFWSKLRDEFSSFGTKPPKRGF